MDPQVNPQILYMWKAPLRAYKKRGRNILRFYLAVALLISLIVFFFGDKVLLIPIWALLFLFYVLTITPPPEVENKLTQFGVDTAGVTIRWETLSHFYFTKRFNFDILTLVSKGPYYLQAYLIVPNEEVKHKAMEILTKHIMYQEIPLRSFMDKMVDWLSLLIPDEEEVEEPQQPTVNSSSLSQIKQPASL